MRPRLGEVGGRVAPTVLGAVGAQQRGVDAERAAAVADEVLNRLTGCLVGDDGPVVGRLVVLQFVVAQVELGVRRNRAPVGAHGHVDRAVLVGGEPDYRARDGVVVRAAVDTAVERRAPVGVEAGGGEVMEVAVVGRRAVHVQVVRARCEKLQRLVVLLAGENLLGVCRGRVGVRVGQVGLGRLLRLVGARRACCEPHAGHACAHCGRTLEEPAPRRFDFAHVERPLSYLHLLFARPWAYAVGRAPAPCWLARD